MKTKKRSSMTLVEHLIELRRRLLISLGVVALCGIGVMIFSNPIVHFLIKPYQHATHNQKLLALDPLAGVSFRLKIGTYGGIALASPFLLWEIWRFISPALKKNEKKYTIAFVASASLLFILGGFIAYLTLPKALSFLATFGGSSLQQQWTGVSYINLLILMILAFGVAFEFPVILIFLLLVRIISTQTLRKYRRHFIVGITIAAAVITPSQDPYSLLLMAIPMYIFFEVSILIGRILKR